MTTPQLRDPFIEAHRVFRNVLELGGGRRPASIRDQILRAEILVERCHVTGLLPRQTPILVVGAGVAGVATAMAAAATGARVDIVEREPVPCHLQLGCTTRYLDPTEYDWPLTHWAEHRYQWTPPLATLQYSADWSHVVANGFISQFAAAQSRSAGRLRFFPSTTASAASASGAGISVILTTVGGATSPPLMYGLAILCQGFGPERTSVGAYKGFAFWDDDPILQTGLHTANATPSVFISGAGDGAIQDALRSLTGRRDATDIYKHVAHGLGSALVPVEQRLQAVEDQCQRALAWAGSHELQHRALKETEAAYRTEVRGLLNTQSKKDLMKSLVRPDVGDVTVAHPCEHFDFVYGLNRFLALMFEEAGLLSVRRHAKTVNITPTKHTCGAPNTCHGQPHAVEIQSAPLCYLPLPIPSVRVRSTFGTFHVILIRHGCPPASPLLARNPLRLPRQIIPYKNTTP